MRKLILSAFILFALVGLVACGSAPTATPAPTQPPLVITVVITPTPQPPTATPVQPALTPIPTIALTTTVPAATPVAKATTAPAATKPPVVRTPTKPPVPPTATAIPLKFSAVGLIQPLWQPPFNETQRDEVKFPGSAMIFKWKSIGGLGGDECYMLNVTSEPINANPPPRSDFFLTNCGDQTRFDHTVDFTLFQPGRSGPSYSSLMLEASEMWVHWTITVVKKLGECADDYHCKFAPLSPPSYRGKFLFKGG